MLKLLYQKIIITINKKSKWITNSQSRKRAHLIRSRYDSIISTSKSINKDNSLLNCRLDGFDNNKPDLFIIDLNLNIKKKLSLFKQNRKRKIYIVTSVTKNNKILYLKKIGLKIINIKSLKTNEDFINLFMILRKRGYNRTLVESGLTFLNVLINKKLIFNLYMFKSSFNLGKNGKNNSTNKILKKLTLKKRIKVNLYNDNLFVTKIK